MTNTVEFFGLTFDLDPVAFTLPIGDGYSIYWYGILIAVGFLLAVLYGLKTAPKLNLNPDRITDGILITVPIAIVCARAYYLLFYSPKDFFADFFAIHEGGLAIYGGVIGAVIGILITHKVRDVNLADTFDLVAPCLLIGQGIGRWGNFFNQEAFGTNTTLPWGMYSEGYYGTYEHILAQGDSSVNPELPVHPCFLYEFILCLFGFLLVNYVIKHRKFKGEAALIYVMWYGTGRFFIEGIRTDSLMLGSVRVSQLLSAVAVVVAAVSFVMLFKKSKQNNTEYTAVFAAADETNTVITLDDIKTDEGEQNIGDDN